MASGRPCWRTRRPRCRPAGWQAPGRGRRAGSRRRGSGRTRRRDGGSRVSATRAARRGRRGRSPRTAPPPARTASRRAMSRQAPKRRVLHEADAEGRTDQPEARRTLPRRRDVGDVGGRGDVGRPRHAREPAPKQQEPERPGQRHDDVVQREERHGRQQHRLATVCVRDRAHHGREEKLRQRPERRPTSADPPTATAGRDRPRPPSP